MAPKTPSIIALVISFLFVLNSFPKESVRLVPPHLTPGNKIRWLRGKSLYIQNCAGCHNANPTLIGIDNAPPVFKSNRTLLVRKVLKGKYPKGYKPKRSSRVMPVFPQLKDVIDDIVIFLNVLEE